MNSKLSRFKGSIIDKYIAKDIFSEIPNDICLKKHNVIIENTEDIELIETYKEECQSIVRGTLTEIMNYIENHMDIFSPIIDKYSLWEDNTNHYDPLVREEFSELEYETLPQMEKVLNLKDFKKEIDKVNNEIEDWSMKVVIHE